MKAKNIIDAYCRIRTIDQTIPDEVLDFMKQAAIDKINENAAAPELLEALERIADLTYSPSESKDLIEDALKINRAAISAISKAKGITP